MVGDWVVTELGCVIIQLKVDDFKQIECNELIVNPIPITENVLRLNGFVDAKFGYGRHCLRIEGSKEDSNITKYYRVEYHPSGCYPPAPDLEKFVEIMLNVGSIRLNCYYVHELQHALRLCGLNELADNFKTVPDSVIFNGNSRSTDGCSKTK